MLKLINASIVVLSEGNNPKLLNHDFLSRNFIVPEDWELQNVVVTPPYALLDYKNGLQFLVEVHKLHIKLNRPDLFAWDSDLPRMAVSYLELLPHVNYQGVGINLVYALDPAPKKTLFGLVHEGPWLKEWGGISGASLELNYRHQQPQLNLKIGVPSKDSEENKTFQPTLSANFHHDFAPQDEQQRREYILSAPDLAQRLEDFAGELPLNLQETGS